MAVKTQQFYYDLLSQGYMFRHLRVIIRPSTELIQDKITSALWDPVVLTIYAILVYIHVNQTYVVQLSILTVAPFPLQHKKLYTGSSAYCITYLYIRKYYGNGCY
jgi:hypothetical protein